MSTPAAYVGEAPVPVIAPHGRVQRTYWQAARRRLLRDPVSMGCLAYPVPDHRGGGLRALDHAP